jgi:hypothetical protein
MGLSIAQIARYFSVDEDEVRALRDRYGIRDSI